MAFYHLRGMMDKNIKCILRITPLVTFQLRGFCNLNWRWCLKIFHVLFVIKRKCGNHVVVWHVPTRLTYDMFNSALDFTAFRWLDLLSISKILTTCYVFKQMLIVYRREIHYCHDDNIVFFCNKAPDLQQGIVWWVDRKPSKATKNVDKDWASSSP